MLSIEYIAGFFDGEGNLSLESNSRGGYALRASFTNTNKDILYKIQEVLGGTVSFRKNPKQPMWKDRGALRLRASETIRFLSLVEPHLVIKRAVVNLGILYATEFEIKGKRSEERKSLQMSYVIKFKEFNKRGIDEPVCNNEPVQIS